MKMSFCAIALLAAVTVFTVQGKSAEKCIPGEALTEYCNSCVCEADGKNKSCTRRYCPPGVYNKDGTLKNPNISFDLGFNDFLLRDKRDSENNTEGQCVPYELFHKYCNTCICTSNGKTATCTNMECPEGVFNKDGSRKPGPKFCIPFSHFKDDCNQCWCSGSGEVAMCTIDECKNTDCEAGKVYRDNCFECACNANGTHTRCIDKFCADN